MYKLNDKEIKKEEVENLIHDLAMFPNVADDYNISIDERIKKYKKALKTDKSLKIAEKLKITIS